MKAHHIFAVVTAFCIFNMASASEGEVDRERMQQDLDIMEGILKSLHTQNTPNLAPFHRELQIRGLYFENYGVIFLIEEERSSGRAVDVVVRRLLVRPAGVIEELEEEDFLKEVAEERRKTRAALQDRLAEFLGTYADGIRQLQDEDRITILVRHKSLSRFGLSAGELDFFWKSHPFPTDELPKLQAELERLSPDSLTSRRDKLRAIRMRRLEAELSEPVYTEVTVKKRDIVAHRRERIDVAEFRKRIVSREHRPHASTMKKIGVMANILDKMIKLPDHPVPYSNKTLGIYRAGLGALFFVNERSGYLAEYRRAIYKELRSPSHSRRQGREGTADSQLRDRLKEDLVEVVGDYGYSLRTLKPEEYIVVEVRFLTGLRSASLKRQGLILKVKKKDVDAYSRGDLDLAAFRQKVDIREY